MKKNSLRIFRRVIRLPHILWLRTDCAIIGGQAVMEGVMMRNGDIYGLAVRRPAGGIFAQRVPWRSIASGKVLNIPFARGFPILMETIVNGIQALDRSIDIVEQKENEKPVWSMAFSLGIALFMAVGLFVVAPHLLSIAMHFLHIGADVAGVTFHLWDGFYKCAIFVFYIWLISFVPDIRRIFEYHGAEHKVVHAWENGLPLSASSAFGMSRLHPRCGTTFLLFVICVSIILQALIVPLLLKIWTPQNPFVKHALAIGYKLLLIVPISAAAYELIRFATRLPRGFWSYALLSPGLAMQRLTTREPSEAQLEVALAALRQALAGDGIE